ncbi:TIGR04423 family type III CRISPR-associated protein [Saprospira grandis]|uniref:Uncharacterized protein n=1 Tax=Saprospira grandis (strain Lewin) TaxID=984262 RepID=H6L9L3_SAPGL|nr:TIGR04423 family type III CRISPR-associated protein [Saprospira grandis]AFC23191.1 hypothetical protein SGRA_0452 [Saprospira grandis str. Lewin]
MKIAEQKYKKREIALEEIKAGTYEGYIWRKSAERPELYSDGLKNSNKKSALDIEALKKALKADNDGFIVEAAFVDLASKESLHIRQLGKELKIYCVNLAEVEGNEAFKCIDHELRMAKNKEQIILFKEIWALVEAGNNEFKAAAFEPMGWAFAGFKNPKNEQ